MLSFTLDTNCLIAVEEERPEAGAVRDLVARQRSGLATVRLVATMAAETQRDGTVLDNFSHFQRRIDGLGFGELEILAPVAVCDLTYLDWCVFAHDDTEAEIRRLHEVLFPTAPFGYLDAVPGHLDEEARRLAERKWRNQQLDVLVLHTHIMAKADVFVSNDRNFRKQSKRPRLAELGAKVILSPADAAAYDAADSA
ncbi:hypothetical protein G3I60_15860 [Streptomyces sp. SID13666]|uniref:hypothetical protein n=1 Tax=Streptomyces sp. SID13666 TaxID=2706054 RepID=UPI0013BEDF13|nr:hypothetical protein [Streptomyces sp. SID13666]NEA55584.1 hypothetical protein [Streptomyces sp. SID13666]